MESATQNRETVTILWTGGWDSTYRMVMLSQRDIIIQPVYVKTTGRKSYTYELQAMDEIRKMLEKKDKTKAEILPTIVVSMESIPVNKDISAAYEVFKKEADMGAQHDYLARLALQYPMMELCIEKALGEHAPIRKSIERHGKLIDTGDGFVVDKGASSEELNLILGNMRLPIFAKTELDMLHDIEAWGYKDVMSHIWFCHDPVGGKPCGLCNPCTTKMTSEMNFLLSPDAQKRNIRLQKVQRVFGHNAAKVYKKIVRSFLK